MSAHDAFDVAVAAYALDALEAGERRAFEAHLASCSRCQAELRDLRRVATALGTGVEAVAPPASLKAKTIAIATAQSNGTAAQAATPPTAPLPVPAAQQPARSSFRWLASAAALAVIAGLGAYALSLRFEVATMRASLADATSRVASLRSEVLELRRDSARLSRTLSVLSAPTMLRVDLRGQGAAPAAVGRAYVSGPRGLVFTASRLPALSPDRIYQLWVISPNAAAPISAGVFPVSQSGDAVFSVDLPPGGDVVKAVAVTLERGPSGAPGAAEGPIVLLGAVGS